MAGKELIVQPVAKRGPGRETTFTQEIADYLCGQLAKGRPLTWTCEEEGMPSAQTVMGWLRAFPAFDQAYREARALGHDAIAADMLRIADTPVHDIDEDVTEIKTFRGVTIITKGMRREMHRHRQLQIDTRRRLLEVWDPRYRPVREPREATSDQDGAIAITILGGFKDEQ